VQASDTPTFGRVRPWELGLVALLTLALYVPFLGSYDNWDPWESHYGEVARRMLEEHDWVKLRWQNESFRSKPVLTFWLMGASFKVFGVADDGGYSGEMATSPKVQWALRLPFALFGCAGILFLWYALARLTSKRVAWLASALLASCPYYFFIARQAITDMPSCAMLIASLALFLLAIFDERELLRWRGKLTFNHLFLGVFALLVIPQLVYMIPNVAGTRLFFSRSVYVPGPWVIAAFIPVFLLAFAWTWRRGKTTTQVNFSWFYLVCGVAVLAKGPPAPGVAGLAILGYLVLTGEWRLLKKCEIPRGIVLALVVCMPWHFAMYLRDGNGWLNEYLAQHLLTRVFAGMFGDRGTFDYYFSQLGVGMWPWVALAPGALAALAVAGRPRTREDKVRLLFGIWAVAAFAFFAFVRTKFHHYVLPAVPGLAVVSAFWLDDLWQKRSRAGVALAIAVVLFLITSVDLVTKQERLVHLFCYRYDRAWPYEQPWAIDFSGTIFAVAVAFGAAIVCLYFPRLRRWAIGGMCAVALVFAAFCVDVLLVAVSPHYGQRAQHRVYYENRVIHGADIFYYGTEELARDWADRNDFEVRSVIPYTLHEGDPMVVGWQLRTSTEAVTAQGEMRGVVSAIDRDGSRFVVTVAAKDPKLAKLAADNRGARDGARRFVIVNADRMISWALLWRGENFYSGGEIWESRIPHMQVAFNLADADTLLQKYLKDHLGQHRTFWVVTEKGSLSRLPSLLPTDKARQTLSKPENFSNKFGLATFTLD
jgi:4-amino-4-deoxy-L-arabinose transferase-like glycosyltransferase